MHRYTLFVTLAALAILSPGPGVLMTLTNAARGGVREAVGGILGIACGAWIVAGLSALGLGVLLATSVLAFALVKLAGAAYLLWLGVRLWRAPPASPSPARVTVRTRHRFVEGLTLQLTNPKAVFFFLAVFPQFMDLAQPDPASFAALVLTYAALVVAIHTGYALLAARARPWLASPRGGRMLNRAGGAVFMFFGAALALAKR